MKKHHISRALLARDRVKAIDEFREEIEIEVTRNYFIFERTQYNERRSAQVAVTMTGSDPERTQAILGEIGASIVDDQAKARAGALARARELYAGQLELAQARRRTLETRAEALWREAAHDPAARAQIGAVQTEMRGVLDQIAALERRADEVAFSAAADEKDLGTNLVLFDDSLETLAPPLGGLGLVRLAALVFLSVLLVSVVVVGAFDDRVYAPEDLTTRGLPVLGALPRFPGDDVGSLGTRQV